IIFPFGRSPGSCTARCGSSPRHVHPECKVPFRNRPFPSYASPGPPGPDPVSPLCRLGGPLSSPPWSRGPKNGMRICPTPPPVVYCCVKNLLKDRRGALCEVSEWQRVRWARAYYLCYNRIEASASAIGGGRLQKGRESRMVQLTEVAANKVKEI